MIPLRGNLNPQFLLVRRGVLRNNVQQYAEEYTEQLRGMNNAAELFCPTGTKRSTAEQCTAVRRRVHRAVTWYEKCRGTVLSHWYEEEYCGT